MTADPYNKTVCRIYVSCNERLKHVSYSLEYWLSVAKCSHLQLIKRSIDSNQVNETTPAFLSRGAPRNLGFMKQYNPGPPIL